MAAAFSRLTVAWSIEARGLPNQRRLAGLCELDHTGPDDFPAHWTALAGATCLDPSALTAPNLTHGLRPNNARPSQRSRDARTTQRRLRAQNNETFRQELCRKKGPHQAPWLWYRVAGLRVFRRNRQPLGMSLMLLTRQTEPSFDGARQDAR